MTTKFFNTAGPINPEDHYYVPHRLNEPELRMLIEQKKYFILHAPRQSGKTTGILSFVKQLNAESKYKALYINVEPAQTARGNVEKGMEIILNEIEGWGLQTLNAQDPLFKHIENGLKRVSGSSLGKFLQAWSSASDKPIILFIDEIDSLVGDTLISVLRQLRAGYAKRPAYFPQTVCLVGVRDVRDYMIWSDSEQKSIQGGSAFNIKAESLTLANFSLEQVHDLYTQHTTQTGQRFDDDAIMYAFQQTQGQPWLVNALAYEACFRKHPDRSIVITKEILEEAREELIRRRDTHLDVLINRLQEPRVRAIIDAIVSGRDIAEQFSQDDVQYILDLGLLAKRGKDLVIANPIYQEVIPRELTYTTQEAMIQQTQWYQNVDGTLNTIKLMEGWTQFWRENAESWTQRFTYQESGPHLLLMAFLQRIINGGGRLHREYALGRRRLDLLIEWQNKQRIVIEVKVHRDKNTLPNGLIQTADYMDINNATEGHLVIFDRTKDKTWDEKIYTQNETAQGKKITIWGM